MDTAERLARRSPAWGLSLAFHGVLLSGIVVPFAGHRIFAEEGGFFTGIRVPRAAARVEPLDHPRAPQESQVPAFDDAARTPEHLGRPRRRR